MDLITPAGSSVVKRFRVHSELDSANWIVRFEASNYHLPGNVNQNTAGWDVALGSGRLLQGHTNAANVVKIFDRDLKSVDPAGDAGHGAALVVEVADRLLGAQSVESDGQDRIFFFMRSATNLRDHYIDVVNRNGTGLTTIVNYLAASNSVPRALAYDPPSDALFYFEIDTASGSLPRKIRRVQSDGSANTVIYTFASSVDGQSIDVAIDLRKLIWAQSNGSTAYEIHTADLDGGNHAVILSFASALDFTLVRWRHKEQRLYYSQDPGGSSSRRVFGSCKIDGSDHQVHFNTLAPHPWGGSGGAFTFRFACGLEWLRQQAIHRGLS